MRKSILLGIVLVVALQSLVEALDEEQKKLCMKFSKSMFKKMLKSFNACNAEMKLTKLSGEEFQKKVGCAVKCVMNKIEVLDENGIMTEEKAKQAIEDHVPEELKSVAHEYIMKCINNNPLDPKDETCASYLKLGTCMQEALADYCGEMPLM